MSDSLWSYGLWPARLLCPWDSPGKNTGMLPFPSPGHLPDPRIEPGLLHYREILYHLSHVFLKPRPNLRGMVKLFFSKVILPPSLGLIPSAQSRRQALGVFTLTHSTRNFLFPTHESKPHIPQTKSGPASLHPLG